MHTDSSSFCPYFHHAIELVGRRWSGAILRSLLQGNQRFTDIRTSIPGLSDRLLSERLKELESEGLVARHVYAETPVRIEYELTDKGRDLEGAISALTDWADRWLSPKEEAVHA